MQRQRQARRKRQAQQRRRGQLQSRVIVASLICFALLWGTVFVQMLIGSDPVLGQGSGGAARRRAGGPTVQRSLDQPRSETLGDESGEGEAGVTEEVAPEVEATPEVEVAPEVEAAPEELFLPETEPEPEPLTTRQS